MSDGDLITQIDEMLEAGTMSAKVCSRLTLQLFRGMYLDQKELKRLMNKIYPAYQITVWLGAALGLSTVALIWSILTHQVVILW